MRRANGRGAAARVGVVLASATLGVSLLGGCTSARSNQGTADESCYLALPTAQKAVGGHGHLAGVRKYSLNKLRALAPGLYGDLAEHVSSRQAVCLAAYKGQFSASQVEKPLGRDSGPLAVAVVTTPGNSVLGTMILERIPVRFQHQF